LLAAARPTWAPHLHLLWPLPFRAAARALLLASHASAGAGAGREGAAVADPAPTRGQGGSGFAGAGAGAGDALAVAWGAHECYEILQRLAHPISAWLPDAPALALRRSDAEDEELAFGSEISVLESEGEVEEVSASDQDWSGDEG
jgi:hypothetical protein